MPLEETFEKDGAHITFSFFSLGEEPFPRSTYMEVFPQTRYETI